MDVWLQFGLCAAVILYAGYKLSVLGDIIADKTGLGKSWIGLVLLATVTSLPELITGISAVTFNDLPDMAVSGTLGSCMFNILVIAALDLLSKTRPVSYMVHQGHILSAAFGIILLGFATIAIVFGKDIPAIPGLAFIDGFSIVFVIIYLIAMKLVFSYEKQRLQEFVGNIAEAADSPSPSFPRALFSFTVHALIIVAAACYLPELGEQIAKITGWGESFIGSLFIAITTSLPEITVSVTAARLGSFDMAVANLLGSNLFNVAILAAIDACYVKGPLLRSVGQISTLSALTAMIATAIVVIGLIYRTEKKLLFVAGDAAAIFIVCVLANVFLFFAH